MSILSQLKKKKEILGNQVHPIEESCLKCPLLVKSIISLFIQRWDCLQLPSLFHEGFPLFHS